MHKNECDTCSGKFGLIRHRWWSEQYCCRRCYEIAQAQRDRVREFLKFLSRPP